MRTSQWEFLEALLKQYRAITETDTPPKADAIKVLIEDAQYLGADLPTYDDMLLTNLNAVTLESDGAA